MTLRRLHTASLVAVLAALVSWPGAACGADEPERTDATSTQGGQEPPHGHSPIPSDGQAQPGARQGMPPGHPPVDGDEDLRPFKGTLVVKAVQGTEGGADLAGKDVVIEMHSRTQPSVPLQVKLDSRGLAAISDTPFDGPVRAVAKIAHQGFLYHGVAAQMDADTPDRIVRVTVYEVTDEEPPWRIAMRHVYLERMGASLHVRERMTIVNPADRTWLGSPESEVCSVCLRDHEFSDDVAECRSDGSETKPTTLILPLPESAVHVQLRRGFSSCCARAMDGRIVTLEPLRPGQTELDFGYEIPAEADDVGLDLLAPAPVGQVVVLVPDDGAVVAAYGLEGGEAIKTSRGTLRVYQASQVAEGGTVSITLGPPPPTQADNAPARDHDDHDAGAPFVARAIAAVGAAVLVIGAIVMLLTRRRAAAAD